MEPLPQWRLIMLALAMCGVQICYAVQIGHGTPQLEILGMDTAYVSLAWLAGPLSGLIVQPLVGALSDKTPWSLGRRRPFLIIGCVLSSLALLMFSNAKSLGAFCARILSGSSKAWSIMFGVLGFFFLDFSVNAIQGPLRALLTDVTPQEQQATGNAYFAFMVGLGNLLGSYLGSLNLMKLRIPLFTANIQVLFFLAMLLLDITIACCCIFTKERSLAEVLHDRELERLEEERMDSASSDAGKTAVETSGMRAALRLVVKEAPRPFWQVFAVQFCAWFGFFSIMVYATAWVARNVFGGSSSAPVGSPPYILYQQGVRLGNVGLSLSAFITILYAAMLPTLMKVFGVRQVYCFSQIVEGVFLCSAFFLRGTPGQFPSLGKEIASVCVIGMMGIFMACAMTIPWSLMGIAVQRRFPDKVGVFSSVFNACQAAPQLVVALISPLILKATGDVSVIMCVGGVSALLGAILVVYLRVGVDESYEAAPSDSSISEEQSLS
ncbi:Sucrose transport protein SUC4 [Porphyridium purpureum]|uniref:Sucrose transport protein SUC4 n=1 Tax=Porphyridium purpureum TaxID=35688 RepID=A0A5J4YYB5_PORPP|nr:Sucrose transport protein SUC4 [Porphyridium purpureum]|eukprot:POR1249..scf209_3